MLNYVNIYTLFGKFPLPILFNIKLIHTDRFILPMLLTTTLLGQSLNTVEAAIEVFYHSAPLTISGV